MQTSLPEAFLGTPEGQRAEAILRSCVHCGFCNATCPTYQLLGDELDGPRGRIYLIKDMLERQTVNPVAVQHLDRCLTCRACETTCPSGVVYGELAEIGRNFQEARYRRGLIERLQRYWLLRVVPNPRAFARWAALGRLARPFLPGRLKRQIPPRVRHSARPDPEVPRPRRTVLLLDGCVQRVATPDVNAALIRLLAARNVRVIRLPGEGCCGALALHLGHADRARTTMQASLDAVASVLDEVDAVVSTASGCGVTLKEYGRLLADDPQRARLAAAFQDKVRDVGELLDELGGSWRRAETARRIALHVPCTLQHGQRQGGHPGRLLEAAGYELLPVVDAHLCCGSAGTYAILQSRLADELGANKVAALTSNGPELIATANVGCQLHLDGLSEIPVRHWLQLLAPDTAGEAGS
jgi:glycolate oxidase iron-sulfur subunit